MDQLPPPQYMVRSAQIMIGQKAEARHALQCITIIITDTARVHVKVYGEVGMNERCGGAGTRARAMALHHLENLTEGVPDHTVPLPHGNTVTYMNHVAS